MSLKNFKNRLDEVLDSKKKAKPVPPAKKPFRSSASFRRFLAEASYSQKKI